MTPSPSRVSVHESGHMTTALHFGHHVIAMRLLPTGAGPYDGCMLHAESIMTADPDEVVIVALSGLAAEKLLCRVADDHALAVGASRDVQEARALLEAIDPAAADAHFTRAEHQAAHLVRCHGPLILTIAAELDRQRVLTAEQVRVLIKRHQEARDAAAVA